jgi:Zn-dependent protease
MGRRGSLREGDEMHDEDTPPQTSGGDSPNAPHYATYQHAPPALAAPDAAGKRRRNQAGGIAVGIGLIAAKFKVVLALLLSFKWAFIAAKLVPSAVSIVVSLWFYMLAFGPKLGIVVVLLFIVHEMGHWVVLRGFGVRVSLPYLIPGLGAFVAQKSPTANIVQDAAAAMAGPGVGIAAAALCQAYGIATGNTFWIVAAHFGYLINLINLIPVPPLDGGRIAGALEPRLWLLGLVMFVAYIVYTGLDNPVAWLFLLLIGVTAIPRALAAWRGVIDPRVQQTPPLVRGAIALAYFAALAFAALGAGQTAVSVPT